ncbi:hypothetical protein R3P38DRAFT_3246453 [Favolaschia claudopus]|uniref:Uncharacterized protein n=1 Tax=Favolaschia claudopus TaxID=2862362 RepID=A0AAV9YYU0_9AGAR
MALSIPHIRLNDLLARRDEGPDSDVESDDEELSEDEQDEPESKPPAPPTPSPTSTPPQAPIGSIIRVPRPGQPPRPTPPSGAMPGSIIRCARHPKAPPRPKATAAEVKARRLLKKHEKDRRARRDVREQRRVHAGGRLKGIAAVRVRRATPVKIDLKLKERFHAPIASPVVVTKSLHSWTQPNHNFPINVDTASACLTFFPTYFCSPAGGQPVSEAGACHQPKIKPSR